MLKFMKGVKMIKITIKKEELQKIYYENSIADACKILKVSAPTLLKAVKDAGIQLKGQSAIKID